MIAATLGLTDVMAATRDMVGELMRWLQHPPSSELPDLLRTFTKAVADLQEQTIKHSDLVVKLDNRLGELPAQVARAVHGGE